MHQLALKCDRVVDVKVMDDGCLVQVTKCGDCANVPVIKDICTVQNKVIKEQLNLIFVYLIFHYLVL